MKTFDFGVTIWDSQPHMLQGTENHVELLFIGFAYQHLQKQQKDFSPFDHHVEFDVHVPFQDQNVVDDWYAAHGLLQ
jgi:hypothetical protein